MTIGATQTGCAHSDIWRGATVEQRAQDKEEEPDGF